MSIVTLYDPDRQKSYTFDGVTEIAHSLSLKVETEAESESKTNTVNNARHEPDRVTLSVIMSEAHDPMGAEGRVGNVLTDLIALKEARTLCRLHTPYRTYLRMLLAEIAVVQDDKMQSGWSGTLTFQEVPAPAAPPKADNNTSTPTASGTVALKPAPESLPLIGKDLNRMHVL